MKIHVNDKLIDYFITFINDVINSIIDYIFQVLSDIVPEEQKISLYLECLKPYYDENIFRTSCMMHGVSFNMPM